MVAEDSPVERDDAAVLRFIERFALDLNGAGVPRMPARVFAGFLATDSGSLTASELSDLLQVSPASVSGAVRYLIQVGMIHREREPGSRRDHYVLRDNVWLEVIDRRNQVLTQWRGTMEEGIEVLGAQTPAGVFLAETVVFFDFLREELQGMLEKWNERKADLLRDRADSMRR